MSTDVSMILREDVSGLGKRGDVVVVAPGYARNFLVPRHLAFKATEGAASQAAAMRAKRAVRDAKDREGAEEIAKVLVTKTIAVSARAGEGGKLFGSITSSDLVKAVEAQTGITLARNAVHIGDHIKTVGQHQVSVRLHTDVEFPLTVEVSAS